MPANNVGKGGQKENGKCVTARNTDVSERGFQEKDMAV